MKVVVLGGGSTGEHFIGALRRYGLHGQADERFDVLSGGQQARLQVLTDMVLVAVIVYVTGGIDSSFTFLYPLIIIVASILLTRAWAFLTAALAFIASGAVLELSYFEVIRSYSMTRPDLRSLQVSILINLFAYAAIAYLSTQLSMKLRQADVQLEEQSGALENLQALHENIVNSMSGGLITTGIDGRVRLVNTRGFEELIGNGRQARPHLV